ncbi:MAG: helix-turn-helix transcriptional regulator [Bryobacterales bacterium]|nr:helix-turn-helix transcriptional regulator [Bryobacterales bacterium]
MDTLSARESQVFQLLVQGVRAKEIAGRLGISAKTVDTFRSSLMRKLNVETKVDLIKYALSRKSYLAAVDNSGRGLSVASSA